MVSLEQPRALAAGAINPLDSMSASAICCGVYLRYGARGPALTSSAMLSFLSFFEVAKVSNLLINSDCSTPSVRAKLTRASWRRVMSLSSSASTASPGATGLPRFLLRGAPIAMSSINYVLLLQTRVPPACSHDCDETSLSLPSFLRWMRSGVNRDSALHSNFPKQYAPTSAEPKKDAAQNHASH